MTRCEEQVLHGHGGWFRCTRSGQMRANGKVLCGLHAPETVAKRKAKSAAFYAARQAANESRYARIERERAQLAVYPEVVAALRALTVACANVRNTAEQLDALKQARAALASTDGAK